MKVPGIAGLALALTVALAGCGSDNSSNSILNPGGALSFTATLNTGGVAVTANTTGVTPNTVTAVATESGAGHANIVKQVNLASSGGSTWNGTITGLPLTAGDTLTVAVTSYNGSGGTIATASNGTTVPSSLGGSGALNFTASLASGGIFVLAQTTGPVPSQVTATVNDVTTPSISASTNLNPQFTNGGSNWAGTVNLTLRPGDALNVTVTSYDASHNQLANASNTLTVPASSNSLSTSVTATAQGLSVSSAASGATPARVTATITDNAQPAHTATLNLSSQDNGVTWTGSTTAVVAMSGRVITVTVTSYDASNNPLATNTSTVTVS